MNVLLVTVDSLRADKVTKRVMPKIKNFSVNNLNFTNCVANGSSTPASFPSILASRHFASIEGLGLPEAKNTVTLAERLQKAGYRTGGFTDNHFASSSYRFDRGFDTMHDASGPAEAGKLKQFVQSNLDKDGQVFQTIEAFYLALDSFVSSVSDNLVEYERAGSLNERALSFIDSTGSNNWFTWLHYMDAHHPYEPPIPYQERFSNQQVSKPERRSLSRRATHHPEKMNSPDWERLETLYDAECAYVDDQFAELVTELEDRGVRDETLIILTADHGELFGGHGSGGHPGEFWEGVIKVPLIISLPGYDGTVSEQVQLLNIAPTITDGIGIPAAENWEGESVLSIADGSEPARVCFGDVGREINYQKGYVRRSDGWKLLDHAQDGKFLFNILDNPTEKSSEEMSAGNPDVLSELEDEIQNHRTRMEYSRSADEGVDEDEKMVRNHLEDLGYLESD